MRKTALAALLIGALGVSLGQAPPSTSGAPETGTDVDMLHGLRRSTVSLGIRRTENGVEHFATVGSGVIVAWDVHNACLLTAKHVFYDPEKSFFPTELYLRLPQTEPRAEDDLGVKLKLVENGQNLWHGADGADLAVIAVPDLSAYKDLHAIFLTDFGGENDVFQGASVVVMGYPELLGPDFQTTPIARNGIVAWTNPDGPLDHTFLVDANVYNGNSGGPVFHLPTGLTRVGGFNVGGSPKLIGIVVRDAAEEAPVHAKENPINATNNQTGEVTPLTARVLNIGGIGIVEPISKALKLINETFNTKPLATP
jgi:Trypsin-like peptidase domain